MLLWLAAGAIGLSAATLLGRNLASRPVPASSLQQALQAFDADDLSYAAASFKRLADSGNADAEYWYGHALERGLGVAPDIRAAIAEYRKAWAEGVPPAGRRLGEIAISGNDGAPNFASGRALLLAAAQKGDARAALDYGRVLRLGIGGPADPVGAYAWLEIAALRGNAQARIERNQLLPSLSSEQQSQAAAQVKALQAGDHPSAGAPAAGSSKPPPSKA
jgi:TPR repeat protein